MQPLTDRDMAILAFEDRLFTSDGAKADAVRTVFDMRMPRYVQLVNALLDNPAAMAAKPMLVKRLLRVRAARDAARRSRVFRVPAVG